MTHNTLMEKPAAAQHAAVAWAPTRFDIHHLPELNAQLASAASGEIAELVLDCSGVAFVDEAAVEAVIAAEQRSVCPLRIIRPSMAMQITFELLGRSVYHERIAA